MLGNIIKDYIDEKGLKQNRIAESSGISNQAFSDALNEKRKIETVEYFRICHALGVNVGYFEEILMKKKEKQNKYL